MTAPADTEKAALVAGVTETDTPAARKDPTAEAAAEEEQAIAGRLGDALRARGVDD